MKTFFIALQFLTRLPVKINSEILEKDLNNSLYFFPLVGGIIGAILLIPLLLIHIFPIKLIVALILTLQALITGCLHLDGFADTIDGFYGGKSKERILEIMKDSRIGSIGVIGLIILILLKVELLSSLEIGMLWKGIISMMVFSRFIQVFLCNTYSYAREFGKAKHFIGNKNYIQILVTFIFTVAIIYILFGYLGIILISLSFLPVFIYSVIIYRRIGGMTGDTIGAASEISEVVMLTTILTFSKLLLI